MRFDVSITHESACTRVGVIGEPTLGRLLSLLEVLEVDSACWPRPAALLDLRGLRAPLPGDEQARFAAQAARALWRMKKIAVVAPATGVPQESAVRFFADADSALDWLAPQ